MLALGFGSFERWFFLTDFACQEQPMQYTVVRGKRKDLAACTRVLPHVNV